ncbi:uncharacterized protein LOC135142136 [Zophobas morio]|uniref:uncharacterized protein LOC135142136 n=1 Tax=Zophobas morio TaxID=2755281 RepID=UPI0030832FB8
MSTTDLHCDVSRYELPLVKEDKHHPCLLTQISIADSKEVPFNTKEIYNNNCHRYNFLKADLPNLHCEFGRINWNDITEIKDVNCAVDHLNGKMYNLFDKFVPRVKVRSSTNFPRWFTSEIIKDIKTKNNYRRLCKKHKFLAYMDKVKSLNRKIKKNIRKEYGNFKQLAQDRIKSEPKHIWSYITDKKKSSGIPGSMKYGHNEFSTPQDIVEGFAQHFSSVYIKCDGTCDSKYNGCNKSANTFDHVCCNCDSDNNLLNNVLHKFIVSEKMITEAARRIKPNLTMGPDNVPAFVVKECITCLITPLLHIFNLILKTTNFPTMWKMSKICPIFKSGCKSDIANYRPISIICNFAKLFETILYNSVYAHVTPMKNDCQHGFVKGRSTTTNLCEFTQFVSESLEQKYQVDVAYTDLSKAFDKVNHKPLIKEITFIRLM